MHCKASIEDNELKEKYVWLYWMVEAAVAQRITCLPSKSRVAGFILRSFIISDFKLRSRLHDLVVSGTLRPQHSCNVMNLNIQPDRCRPRSVQEQSDQGLQCLPFHLHRLDTLLQNHTVQISG